MKLLHDPDHPSEEGESLAVPPALKRFIFPWATPIYREYDFGYTLIQVLQTNKFSIHSWRIRSNKQTILYPVSDRPIIALQFTLGNDIPSTLQGYGPKLLEKSKYELFYVSISTNSAQFEPGEYESLHIELEPEQLEDLRDSFPAVGALLVKLTESSKKGSPLVAAHMNYVVMNILNKLRSEDKTGGKLVFEMQKYILELLSEYIAAITDLQNDQTLREVPHKKILIQVKQFIMQEPNIREQTIKKLAIRFGLSPTALKSEFSAMYEVPLGSFVRFHALTKAHYLIATTKLNIDYISDEVGYPYRPNFNQVFKKQFGYLPQDLRKDFDHSDT